MKEEENVKMSDGSPLTKEMEKAFEEHSEKVNSELDQLYAELEKGDYFKRSYPDDSVVEIPGLLFARIVNYINAERTGLLTIAELASYISRTINGLTLAGDTMTVDMMKAHKKNVDDGKTITLEELEKQDAKKIIVPTEASKKKGKVKATIKE